MKNEQFDYFFNSASKIVVVIPIVVLAVALVFYLDKTKSTAQKPDISKNNVPTINITPKETKTSEILTIDINKNYVCRDKMRSAYIFKKQLFMESVSKKKTTNYMFDGDCLYTWEKGKYAGWKTCGL